MSEGEENQVLTFGELMRRKGHPELAPPEPEASEPTLADQILAVVTKGSEPTIDDARALITSAEKVVFIQGHPREDHGALDSSLRAGMKTVTRSKGK